MAWNLDLFAIFESESIPRFEWIDNSTRGWAFHRKSARMQTGLAEEVGLGGAVYGGGWSGGWFVGEVADDHGGGGGGFLHGEAGGGGEFVGYGDDGGVERFLMH